MTHNKKSHRKDTLFIALRYFLFFFMNFVFKKDGQVITVLLYSSYRACRCKGCVIFKFNDKSLHRKNDSERRHRV